MDIERLAALAAALVIVGGIVAPTLMVVVALGILVFGLVARAQVSHVRFRGDGQNRP